MGDKIRARMIEKKSGIRMLRPTYIVNAIMPMDTSVKHKRAEKEELEGIPFISKEQ
jgi:hypothetical protein